MRFAVAAAAVVGCVAAAAPAVGSAAGCLPVDHASALEAAGTHAWPGKTRQSDLPFDMLSNF